MKRSSALAERLDSSQLAAYLDGWTGLLDLLRRTQLILPHADAELHDGIAEVVERIRAAASRALDDGSG